jgi:hypothetical protein
MEFVHLRVPSHAHAPHHDLHGTPLHATVAFVGGIVDGIADAGRQVGGVFVGIGEQAVDTVGGIVEAVTNPVETVQGIAQLVTNPGEAFPALWQAITQPIEDDWKNGNHGEAIGRGIFGVAEVVFGAKGLTKLGKLRHADELSDAARVGKAALIERTFGKLDDVDAAFAQRLNVQHVFHGDEFGGLHHVRAPGRHGNVDVTELRHAPGRTWQAEVRYVDADGVAVTKKTTMFPREWSPTEVLQSIRRAEEGAVSTGKTRQVAGREIEILEGSDRGLKIVLHRDVHTREVLSAHPKHVNKVPE